MATIPRDKRLLFAAVFAAFFLFGVSNTIMGAALPRILDSYGWLDSQAGIVMASGSLAFFLASFVAGRLVGRLGAGRTLAMGYGINVLGLALFGTGPELVPNMLLYALIGVGQGFIEVAANWAVLRMAGGESSGKALSLVHGAYAIGAVTGPLMTGALLASGISWQTGFRASAVMFGILFVSALVLPFRSLGTEDKAAGSGKARSLASRPAYWLGALSLLLYVGAEHGLSNWSAELFDRILLAPAAVAALVPSIFWLGLLAGRLGIPAIFPRTKPQRTLVFLGVGMVASYGMLALSAFLGPQARPLAWLAIALAGLSSSAVYPMVVSIVAYALPDRQGEATGFAATGGGLGGFAFPLTMATVSTVAGLSVGFSIYAAVAVMALVSHKFLIGAAEREHAGRSHALSEAR
ncbi:MAG: MFS transporter [Spirochaetales bacterium]|nr:MFS transporter [Spirochaetales bacterium]